MLCWKGLYTLLLQKVPEKLLLNEIRTALVSVYEDTLVLIIQKVVGVGPLRLNVITGKVCIPHVTHLIVKDSSVF